MAEFNLSYTAEDINRKLGKIDTLEQDVNKLNNEKVDYSDLEDEEFQTAVAQKVPFVKTAEQPTMVDSIDEMTDTSKVYVLSEDGYFYKYTGGNTLVEKLTADDFTQTDMTVNGLPYTASYGGLSRLCTKDILPLDGCTIAVSCPSAYYGFIVYFYNTDTPTETDVGTLSENLTGKTTWLGGSITDITTVTCSTGTLDGATHYRIAFRHNSSAANITDYIDELVASEPVVITYHSAEAWANTGLAYNQSADYEDRILALEHKSEQHIHNNALYGTTSTQEMLTVDNFEKGGLFANDGTETSPTLDSGKIRARTEQIACTVESPISIVCNSNAKWLVHFFNNGTWLGKTNMVSTSCDDVVQLWTNPNDVTHVRILIGYTSDVEVTNIADLLSNFTIRKTISGEPIIATREWVKSLLGGIENGNESTY